MDVTKFTHRLLPIVIPAYEPDGDFAEFISSLTEVSDVVIIVDDGSGKKYRDVFDKAEKNDGVTVLRHAVNLGKGRSLKDAFNYVLDQYPDALGIVTADADGQHLLEDIQKISDALRENPRNLVLGCRNFQKAGIPWKSRFGNNLTRKICAFLCGVNVSDTQTGLRGIPANFLKILMHTPGERYEYETNMLLECNNGIQITEVPISTVYDSCENHKTHFDPLWDSIIIYKVILAYSLSSVLATFIDFLIFTFATGSGYGIWRSTVMARTFAAFANFLLNKKVVFKSKGNGIKQFMKYVLLVAVSGMISAFAISLLQKSIPTNLIIVKAVVETCLFFFNYYVQRTFIFVKRKGEEMEKSLFSDEIIERTDWTQYYKGKRSWISSFTQRYTLESILVAMNEYVNNESDIRICEMGGGNSCFAIKICEKKGVRTYDIIDSNELAVRLFGKMHLAAKYYRGICRDLLMDDTGEKSKYDFVYSVGLIEHFRGKDIRTMISRHFEFCKDDGIVLITFPTPTKKYIFTRKLMEFFGVWRFHDEKPIRYEEIEDCFKAHGEVLEHYINRKLYLTQEIVITRKGNSMLCQ